MRMGAGLRVDQHRSQHAPEGTAEQARGL